MKQASVSSAVQGGGKPAGGHPLSVSSTDWGGVVAEAVRLLVAVLA
jgi:hypothetical protein